MQQQQTPVGGRSLNGNYRSYKLADKDQDIDTAAAITMTRR